MIPAAVSGASKTNKPVRLRKAVQGLLAAFSARILTE
jgi:hypothetical protein